MDAADPRRRGLPDCHDPEPVYGSSTAISPAGRAAVQKRARLVEGDGPISAGRRVPVLQLPSRTPIACGIHLCGIARPRPALATAPGLNMPVPPILFEMRPLHRIAAKPRPARRPRAVASHHPWLPAAYAIPATPVSVPGPSCVWQTPNLHHKREIIIAGRINKRRSAPTRWPSKVAKTIDAVPYAPASTLSLKEPIEKLTRHRVLLHRDLQRTHYILTDPAFHRILQYAARCNRIDEATRRAGLPTCCNELHIEPSFHHIGRESLPQFCNVYNSPYVRSRVSTFSPGGNLWIYEGNPPRIFDRPAHDAVASPYVLDLVEPHSLPIALTLRLSCGTGVLADGDQLDTIAFQIAQGRYIVALSANDGICP